MVRGRALPFAARLFENEEPPPQVREFCRARLLRTCPNKGARPWRAALKGDASRRGQASLSNPPSGRRANTRGLHVRGR